MIKRVLLYFLIIFVGYNLLLYSGIPDSLFSIQGQWHENRINAQSYMSLQNEPAIILVGSSLSAHLKPFLKDKVQNLSFAGGSPVTGLELILQKGGAPRIILIETNLLHMESDPVLLGDACLPVIKDMRRFFPALQSKYAPVCLITGICRQLSGRDTGKALKVPEDQINPLIFDRELKRHIDNGQKLIKKGTMDNQLQHVSSIVEALEKQGSKCVFVQFPVDPAVASTPLARQWQQAVKNKFQQGRYEWLIVPSLSDYSTTDGIHLTFSSCEAFSKIIIERSAFISREASRDERKN